MQPASEALDRAHAHATSWLDSLPGRPVPPRATAAQVAHALGHELPDGPSDPADVVDLLATASEPGLTAMPAGRFFGFVIGGTHPAALATDWLVTAWDQNAGLRNVTPAATAVEDVAEAWVVDLLGLPARICRRLRHRRDDGQLHLPRRRTRRGAAPGRVGRRRPGAGRLPGRPRAGGGGAARLGRPRAALPRPR